VFEQLHGLNETELAVAFNDVDYCLRAREAGYLVVYTPYAELYHHESKSRGYETDRSKRDRLARETAFMQQRHGDVLNKGDPYYNPNLSLTNNFEPDPHYADGLPL
jgi:GT2 family glycosyltransferase